MQGKRLLCLLLFCLLAGAVEYEMKAIPFADKFLYKTAVDAKLEMTLELSCAKSAYCYLTYYVLFYGLQLFLWYYMFMIRKLARGLCYKRTYWDHWNRLLEEDLLPFSQNQNFNLSRRSGRKRYGSKLLLSKESRRDLFYTNILFNEKLRIWVAPSSQLQKLFRAIDLNQRGSSLMNFEWARYETYKTFPMESPAMPSRLAANGFFYTEDSDTVMCFSCNLKYGGWKSGDNPSEIHRRLSPQCLFINNSDNSNIPIHERNETTMQGAVGRAVQGAVGEFSVDTDGRHVAGELRIRQQNRQDQGRMTTRTSPYKHPDYANIAARRSSFTGWPSGHVVAVEELVRAGFFYVGFGDCVRCFSCGGGLKNWQYGDTPLGEHRTWFPTCYFLLELGSLEFNTPRLDTLTEGRHSNENAVCQASAAENSSPAYAQSTKVNESAVGAQDTVSEGDRTSIIKTLFSMGFGMQAVQTCISSVWNKNGSVSLDTVLDDLLQNSSSKLVEKETKEREESLLTTNDSNSSEKQKKEDESKEPSQIEEENSVLKSQIMCKICMEKTSNVVFRPCGHMVSCDSCSQRLRKCALCRQLIEGRITVFNSS